MEKMESAITEMIGPSAAPPETGSETAKFDLNMCRSEYNRVGNCVTYAYVIAVGGIWFFWSGPESFTQMSFPTFVLRSAE